MQSYGMAQHQQHQHQQQQQQHQQQSFAQAAQPVPVQHAAPAASTEPQLLPGWLQQFDPNTNRYYYVNPQTQQSTWDPPLAPEPQAVSVQPTIMQTQAQAQAQAAMQPAVSPQPAVAPAVVSTPGVTPPEVLQIGALVEEAVRVATAAEKRQMGVLSSSYDALVAKARAGAVDATILEKLDRLSSSLMSQPRNLVQASAIHQDLANSEWNAHKDWVRGLKILIQVLRR